MLNLVYMEKAASIKLREICGSALQNAYWRLNACQLATWIITEYMVRGMHWEQRVPCSEPCGKHLDWSGQVTSCLHCIEEKEQILWLLKLIRG